MAKLIYTGATSVDGFLNDADGNFDWAAPDEQVHAFINDLERSVGTHLLGRRMYEVLRYWEDPPDPADQPAVEQDYARIWQAADKVVYSTTLPESATTRTRIERDFDAEAVRRLKAGAAADLSIGGPQLAAYALRAGLVDEVQQFLAPVVVGGGTRFLPEGLRMSLDLLEERRFASGFVYLRYAVRAGVSLSRADEDRRTSGSAGRFGSTTRHAGAEPSRR